MTERSIISHAVKLRRAAEQARFFADTLKEPNAKQGFLKLADRWEAEASALELKIGSGVFHGLGGGRENSSSPIPATIVLKTDGAGDT